EFGGIAFSDDLSRTWGYSRCRTTEQFAAAFEAIVGAVESVRVFAGFCYTQLADTYQETTGLLYPDRRPKIPLERVRALMIAEELEAAPDPLWRERLMQSRRTEGS